MPNLGGLCRTCEIFGVGKMTIPSSAALKDKDFTGISVTVKKEGWTLVAIEQEIKINKFFHN